MGLDAGPGGAVWLKRYGYLISISLFVAFKTLRKVGLRPADPGGNDTTATLF